MRMDRRADDRASKKVVYIAVSPVDGELRTTWTATVPRGGLGRGKYAGPPSATPVTSSQLSTKAAWSHSTAGPSTRTSVSRQWSFILPLPTHFSLTPEPPVKPTVPSTTSSRRWLRLLALCSDQGRTGRYRCTSHPAFAITSR